MAAMPSLKVDTSLKGILLLTLPISVANLIPELNYLLNAAFLGHLGSKELALTGITGVYYLIFAAIGYGLNAALLSIMSRRAGENNRDDIFATLWHGIVIALVLSVVFIVFTWIVTPYLIRLTNIEPSGAQMAEEFLNIRIFGIVFLYLIQMQNAYLISLQRTKVLMIVAFVQASVNLGLDYGLIFGHFGMPKLGFMGAAYASVLSEIAGAITVFVIIRYLNLSKLYDITISLKISLNKIKQVLMQGLPLMGQYAISTSAWWMFYVLISRNYNYDEQAISQTMRNLFGLSSVFTWAFGSSTNTILSNLIGQGRQNELFGMLKRLTLISTIGIIIFLTILNAYPRLFFDIFGQGDGFIAASKGPLFVVSVAILILGMGVISLNAVVATGNTKVVFWIEFAGISCYLIYVYTVAEILKLSLEVAWMSEWVYWGVILVLGFWYLRYGNWRNSLSLD